MRYTLALLALLCGCAAPMWTHPTKDEAGFRQDALQCDYEATAATAAIRSGVEAGYMKADLARRCMFARGYTQMPAKR